MNTLIILAEGNGSIADRGAGVGLLIGIAVFACWILGKKSPPPD